MFLISGGHFEPVDKKFIEKIDLHWEYILNKNPTKS